MAHTKHQTVVKVAPKAGKNSPARNSDLKQAAHQGKAPVKDAKKAQPGYTAVPVSVATMPPGAGPAMSSTPAPAGRGSSKRTAKSKSAKSATPSVSGGAAQATQGAAPVVQQKGSKTGGGTASKRRGRASKRKR